MAGSVNKVILLGNVGRDPEIRNMQNDDPIANLTVATSESWTDKRSGERQERTEWNRVVVFNPHLAKIVEKYVKKGSRVYLEGQMQTRKWTGQDGVERISTEVVVPRFGGQLILLSGSQRGEEAQPQQRQQRWRADLDAEIPF